MSFMDKLNKKKSESLEDEYQPVQKPNNMSQMPNSGPSNFSLSNNQPNFGGNVPPNFGQPNGQPMPPNFGQGPQTSPAFGQNQQQGQLGGQQMPPNFGQQRPPVPGQPSPNFGQQQPNINQNPNFAQGQPPFNQNHIDPNFGPPSPNQMPMQGQHNPMGQPQVQSQGQPFVQPSGGFGQPPQNPMGGQQMPFGGKPQTGQQNSSIGGNFMEETPNPNNPLANKIKKPVAEQSQNFENFDKDSGINMPKPTTSFNVSQNKIDPEYYGPLRQFFENNRVSTIHMYGHEYVSYQVDGKDVVGSPIWETEEDMMAFLEKLINWNDKNPHEVKLREYRQNHQSFGTFYMKDLSRLHISITEETIYATIAIKRQDAFTLDDLSKFGMFDDKVKTFLIEAIQANAKIILAGQGGVGKTTFLQALGNMINPQYVTLIAEEYRELTLSRPNVKYVNASDKRPLYKIVAESTKMRIRNLVVGEVIGQEALAMLEAMNTGLDVVLATTHANGAYHALNRLITLSCYNPNVNPKFVKQLIGENVDLILYLETVNGKRVLSEIIAIERYQDEIDKIIANHLYSVRNGQTQIKRANTNRIMKKIDEFKKAQRGTM